MDIWFKDDIRNMILAADRTNAAALAAIQGTSLERRDPETLMAYQFGFRAALSTIAIAAGLKSIDLHTARPTGDGHGKPGPQLRLR